MSFHGAGARDKGTETATKFYHLMGFSKVAASPVPESCPVPVRAEVPVHHLSTAQYSPAQPVVNS